MKPVAPSTLSKNVFKSKVGVSLPERLVVEDFNSYAYHRYRNPFVRGLMELEYRTVEWMRFLLGDVYASYFWAHYCPDRTFTSWDRFIDAVKENPGLTMTELLNLEWNILDYHKGELTTTKLFKSGMLRRKFDKQQYRNHGKLVFMGEGS